MRRTQLNHPARRERVLGIPWDAEGSHANRSIMDVIQFSGRFSVVYHTVPEGSHVRELKVASKHCTWLGDDLA